jgi:cell division septum initiation protein DivIVA
MNVGEGDVERLRERLLREVERLKAEIDALITRVRRLTEE